MWRGIIERSWIHVLNAFVYYISLPALLLISFWNIDWTAEGLLPTLGFNFLAVLAFAVLLFLILSVTKLAPRLKASVFLTVMVGNTVYIGFPIMQDAFGAVHFGQVAAIATAHILIGLVLAIMVIEYWAVRSKKAGVYVVDFLKNPLIHGVAIGTVLSLIGFNGYLADIIKKPLSMLGATASPVALFALGAFMYGKFIQSHFKLTSIIVGLKLIALPLFVLFIANWFSLSSVSLGISALSAGVPVAVTVFVIAEQYKLDLAFVGNAILLSTAASIVTLSMFLLKFV